MTQLGIWDAPEAPPPAAPDLGLRYYQQEAREAVHADHAQARGTVVECPTGCHRAGQLIMMSDGSLKRVEDVVVGDALMGLDSTPRLVTALARGEDEMVEIVPVKGEPWVVNIDHVLTLVRTNESSDPASSPCNRRGGELVDVTVREWLTWTKWMKHIHKLLRVPVTFPPRLVPPVEPYALGVMIGDGRLVGGIAVTTPDMEIWDEMRIVADSWGLRFAEYTSADHCPTFRLARKPGAPQKNPLFAAVEALGLAVLSEGKFIPDAYKLGSRHVRLDILAGLIDTDGHMTAGGFDFISKSPRLAHDVAFVSRSLGLAAYVKECQKGCQTGAIGTYHRVTISGDCSIVPCRVPRKRAPMRQQKKSALRTGFSVRRLGTVERYYGFSLDGDCRYLLGDFTVTHNTGKSRLGGALAWDEHIAGGRTLVLTPTITLTRQMYNDMRALGLRCGMEQASNRVDRPPPPVVVASVDSMRGDRLASFDPSDFTHIITDECHRCVSSKYSAIYAHFAKAKLTGLTATPDRADGISLGNVYDRVAYKMTMLRAIKEGWLVPLRFKTAITDFDATKLRTIAGDIDAGSVAAEIMRSGLLHEAANTLAELSEGERTVAFLPTVAASQAFVGELEARGVPAIHVDASTPEQHRDEAVAQFVAGTVRVLSNVGIFVEGWDCPSASVVALLNPTKSRSRVCQMIGRCTRLAPGKESALVLDFCPGRLRKGRLASPADALAGEMLPDNVHAQLKDGDIAESIAQAEVTAADIEAREKAKRERSERKKLRRKELAALARQKRYRYDVHEHDAAALLGGDGRDGPTRSSSHDAAVRPATPSQQETLTKFGIPPEQVAKMDGVAASRLIGKLIERARAGYASLNQLKAIRRWAQVPDSLPFNTAHRAMDYLKGECDYGRRRKVDAQRLENILRGG